MNRLAANVAKWRPVLEIGASVRVLPGFTYAGKRGRITERGTRPDGRVFWMVRLEIPSQSAGNPDREYHSNELVAL